MHDNCVTVYFPIEMEDITFRYKHFNYYREVHSTAEWDDFFGAVDESQMFFWESSFAFFDVWFSPMAPLEPKYSESAINLGQKRGIQKVASILDRAVEYERFTGTPLHMFR